MGCSVCKREESGVVTPQVIRPSQHLQSQIRIIRSNLISHQKGPFRTQYTVGQVLGEGSCGLVRLATHKRAGFTRAVKTIRKSRASHYIRQPHKLNEIEALKNLDHPNIIRLFEVYEDLQCYHLVLEHVNGGELLDLIKENGHIDEHLAACFLRQILCGVAYCHSKQIVHRDLKPENLMLETGTSTIRIIDFSTAAIGCGKLTRSFGTSNYVAPEVLNQNYNEKCDLWSCGVILYLLLSGCLPFAGRNRRDTFEKVLTGTVDLKNDRWKHVSAAGRELVQRMLTYDPAQRISAAAALKHPWIVRSSGSPQTHLQTLTTLANFRTHSKVQQFILLYIANQFMQNEQTNKLTQVFLQLDRDQDGRISMNELVQAYRTIMDRREAKQQAKTIFKQADTSRSGFIEYSEFLMAAADTEELVNSRTLKAVFAALDQGEKGKLTLQTFQTMLCSPENTGVSKSVWDDLITEAEDSSENELDINEFQIFMTKQISLN